jgi:DNA-binding NarL/FixJ family response regulator/CheY-like chemotaxis protein
LIRILHINPSMEENPALDLVGFTGDVSVDSVQSLLEGIIASKQQSYDGIVFNDTSEQINGLDILNTMRQNEVTAPVLFTNAQNQQIQIYESGNRRRYDLETENLPETMETFIENIRSRETKVSFELSYTQLATIVDLAAIPILVLNEYASIVYANRLACDFLGFSRPEELFNNSLNRIFPLKSALSGRKDIPSLISERSPQEQSFYWEIHDFEGNHKFTSVRATRINNSGPTTTVIQFLTGNENHVSSSVTGDDEVIVGVYCNSRMIRSGLESTLDESTFFTEFIDTGSSKVTGEDFVGTSLAIYACSHFNQSELEQMQSILSGASGRPFLLVALAADDNAIKQAMESGVRGFILGEEEFGNVSKALAVLEMGGSWLASNKFTPAAPQKQKAAKALYPEVFSKLTKRETQVLSMLAKGMKNHDIADNLKLSYRTVVTHVYNIYRKLNLSSRTEAIHLAIASGLVDLNS